MKDRSLIVTFTRVMKGRNVFIEVNRGLRNSILLPTVTYRSETWTWNTTQQSKSVCCRNELPERKKKSVKMEQ